MQNFISVFNDFSNKSEDKQLTAILDEIKLGVYKKEVEEIRHWIRLGDKNKADKLKKQLPAFTVAGTFEKRNAQSITDYNQLLILDIDNQTDEELKKIINLSRLAPYTFAHFKSPSGKGLKIIVKINSKKEHHKVAYSQVVDYYKTALETDIDTSGSDICRLCFISYDEQLYQKSNALIFNVITENPTAIKQTSCQHQKSNNIEAYIQEIERKAIDITGNYETWRNLGFAISEEYGESGRDYYHRISKFHPSYEEKECDQQFNNCLNAKGSGVNISTFYYMAHQNNIRPAKEPIEKEALTIKEELPKEEYSDSPTFSNPSIPQLPQFLKKVVKYSKTDQEKDIMILGSITAISACLPNIYGIYDGDKVYSNLYLFVTAAAASGKGKLKFCKRLVYKIHQAMREEARLLEGEYDAELAHYNMNKAKDENLKKPKKPPIKMLFIPANNSSTGMFQLLYDCAGRGLIFETEADTLAKNFKTDYGDYSDGFRNAFHHEPIKYFRRTDREYVEIEEPCLSCVLSGTPKQVLALMPNAENGLFSRFMFYQMPTSANWKNVFAVDTKKGLNDYFDQLGDEFFELYKQLTANTEIQFSYTEKQQEAFNQFFSKINLYYLNVKPLEYNSSIKRMGIIAFRISMIFTVLRILETGDTTNPLICSDIDFQSTLTMVKVLVKHSSKVYSSLPADNTAINYKNNKEQFIESLPVRFTTKDYIFRAKKLKINQKTAERYITEFCKSGILARESQGNYYNPSKEGSEGIEENKGTEAD